MKKLNYLSIAIALIILMFSCKKNDDGPVVVLSTEKKITAFSFEAGDNPTINSDVIGTIDESGKSISINVPFGTDITSLNPAISVSSNASLSTSGSQDFTNPVLYTVTAEDTSTTTYIVSVNVIPNNMNQITTYEFRQSDNIDLNGDIKSVIDEAESTIVLYVPNNTDVSDLSPNIEISEAATYLPTGAQDFTDPIVYSITAEDGTNRDYTISVQPIQITDFVFMASDNTDLDIDISSVIDQQMNQITLYVPNNTDISDLKANVTTTDKTLPDHSVSQDFNDSVNYIITAPNESTSSYQVNVLHVRIDSFKFFETFGDRSEIGVSTIDQAKNEIEVIVDENRNRFNLPNPEIQLSGSFDVLPLSKPNFNFPSEYTLIAPNGVKVDYLVTVRRATKVITGFRFRKSQNTALDDDVIGSINEDLKIISIVFPKGTNQSILNSLTPTITVESGSGATVSPTGSRNFSSPVSYTVTALDGSVKVYTVTTIITPDLGD